MCVLIYNFKYAKCHYFSQIFENIFIRSMPPDPARRSFTPAALACHTQLEFLD